MSTINVTFNPFNESYYETTMEELAEQEGYGVLKLDSLRDQLKFEALKDKFYNIPENELDEFLSKY